MSRLKPSKSPSDGFLDVLASQVLAERYKRIGEASKASLRHFLRNIAWPAILPGTPFSDNWHIGAICEHLEAVTSGEIRRLVINMPFRLLKSTIISQAWPAWEWASRPHLQYLTASYAKDVATRDAVNSRRVIESDIYQACFSDVFTLTSDQNVKTRYDNDRRGMRTITATDAAGTGFGGNRVIMDDPISSLDANNESARNTSIEWYRGTAATRLNDPAKDAIVLVHQRLHEMDLTGYILENESDAGWVHLILPMRYEKKHSVTTGIGFTDPRKVDGALLHPARLPEDVVSQMEKTLGPYHTSAQLQQRPTSRGGTVLDSSWFGRYTVLPRIIRRNIFADTAQKLKQHNDYSVLELWGRGDDGKIYLIDMLRGKWEGHDLNNKVVDFWNKHAAYDELLSCPLGVMKIEEASSGTGLIQYIRNKGGIPVSGVTRTKDKLERAYDGQPYMQSGLVSIPANAPFVSDFCSEVDRFSKDGKHDHDDQIDPMLDAINDMLAKPSLYSVL